MSEKSIRELQDETLETFGYLEDWLDRYQQIIDMGQSLPAPPASLHRDENLIKGCQSRVWIQCEVRDGRLHFHADSDAVITKGIAALLVGVLTGHTAREILDTPLYLIDRLGLKENLSPTRANGLVSMVERIQAYAREHAA
ncbi:MAG: Fe-S metabolism protein SufE [Bacteroidia bacterium]|nr:MAG: Fe-S metabolism protein SufE [Bacteroidia bacterium]